MQEGVRGVQAGVVWEAGATQMSTSVSSSYNLRQRRVPGLGVGRVGVTALPLTPCVPYAVDLTRGVPSQGLSVLS